jgi:hypothetical protein
MSHYPAPLTDSDNYDVHNDDGRWPPSTPD